MDVERAATATIGAPPRSASDRASSPAASGPRRRGGVSGSFALPVWPLVISGSVLGLAIALALVAARSDGGGRLAVLTALLVGAAALPAAWTALSRGAGARRAASLGSELARARTELAAALAMAAVLEAADSRHRSLIENAADGVVELDGTGRVRRANGAFCSMCGLEVDDVVGLHWQDLAARVDGGASLSALPETGRAVLDRPAGTIHLEASASGIPGPEAGTLLVVRDATAGRAAEQTVRSLLKFLQDRDEDRSRLLRRSNAAIEAERNRIARDLHDGPIQGVSAAALWLEAVRLMLATNDVPLAMETLGTICRELSEEAMNLRRIMSDLRSPVLEQRGLIPAVRELAARVTRQTGAPVKVHGGLATDLPPDVETLGYRVVQEALSNAVKHARPSSLEIRIEGSAGNLRVEVSDDGRGFDATDHRVFLRDGKVGLASMRERAELAGGSFTIRGRMGRGTTVTAILPFDVLGAVAVTP